MDPSMDPSMSFLTARNGVPYFVCENSGNPCQTGMLISWPFQWIFPMFPNFVRQPHYFILLGSAVPVISGSLTSCRGTKSQLIEFITIALSVISMNNVGKTMSYHTTYQNGDLGDGFLVFYPHYSGSMFFCVIRDCRRSIVIVTGAPYPNILRL